ncbi:DUF2760 domain-containing protein [Rhodopila sp.]|jgi:hypothetical protein|uniref:DUF2760 domain-containing protein n=1 Tax=Rhodopila sp. TaxID=2480087 RepID=UPI002C5C4635|nr:DUF2760 domain-containing protein [Rhodopila sp.]HVZ07281.1 DUF2760 domain-containing protein [Rhodopila sp.]
MKAVSLVALLLVVAISALAMLLALHVMALPAGLQPVAGPLQLSAAALGLAIIALVAVAALQRGPTSVQAPVAEAVRPAPPEPATATKQADAEIVAFLGLLQAKGRLVDFLMDNINAYNDAQVGAAARVVHAGCRAVLDEHFQIVPIRTEKEQSRIEVPTGYAADEYRLLGKLTGQPPFTGALVHHGWRTDVVKLPAILRGPADRLPAIAPAEVELK